jgi:hypothetical protein
MAYNSQSLERNKSPFMRWLLIRQEFLKLLKKYNQGYCSASLKVNKVMWYLRFSVIGYEDWSFGMCHCVFSYPKNGGSTFFWNIGTHLPNYMVSSQNTVFNKNSFSLQLILPYYIILSYYENNNVSDLLTAGRQNVLHKPSTYKIFTSIVG